MRVLHLISIYLLLGLVSCTVLLRESREAGEPPVIEKIFAAKLIPPGDSWKVYIKASDPDGDMSMFILDFYHASSPNYLGISKKDRERLSGYLRMDTNQPLSVGRLFGRDIGLTVIIEDSAGNQSNAFALELLFEYRVKPEKPDVGVFEEEFLGMIPVDHFQPKGGGSN